MDARGGDPDEVVEREKQFWNTRDATYEWVRNLIGRSIGPFSSYEELDALADPAGLNVLDYGCGRGDDAIALVRRGAAHVTGFDVSEREIEYARAAADSAGVADLDHVPRRRRACHRVRRRCFRPHSRQQRPAPP